MFFDLKAINEALKDLDTKDEMFVYLNDYY
jgi:hypothetical protein